MTDNEACINIFRSCSRNEPRQSWILIHKYSVEEPIAAILSHLQTLGIPAEGLQSGDSNNTAKYFRNDGDIPPGDYVPVTHIFSDDTSSSSSSSSVSLPSSSLAVGGAAKRVRFLLGDQDENKDKDDNAKQEKDGLNINRAVIITKSQVKRKRHSAVEKSQANFTPVLIKRLQQAIPKFSSANGQTINWQQLKAEAFADTTLTEQQLRSSWLQSQKYDLPTLENEQRHHEQLKRECTLCANFSNRLNSPRCQWCTIKNRLCLSTCLGHAHFPSVGRTAVVPLHLATIDQIGVAIRLAHLGIATNQQFNQLSLKAQDLIRWKLSTCVDGSFPMFEAFAQLRPLLPRLRVGSRTPPSHQRHSIVENYMQRLSEEDYNFLSQQIATLETHNSDVLVNATVSQLHLSDLQKLLSSGVVTERLANVFLQVLSAQSFSCSSARTAHICSVQSFEEEDLVRRALAWCSKNVIEDETVSSSTPTLLVPSWRNGSWEALWFFDPQIRDVLLIHTAVNCRPTLTLFPPSWQSKEVPVCTLTNDVYAQSDVLLAVLAEVLLQSARHELEIRSNFKILHHLNARLKLVLRILREHGETRSSALPKLAHI